MTNAQHATNCTAEEFLGANEIKTWADLPANQWPAGSDAATIANVMIANWTFDGAMTPDSGDLVVALEALSAAKYIAWIMGDEDLEAVDLRTLSTDKLRKLSDDAGAHGDDDLVSIIGEVLASR